MPPSDLVDGHLVGGEVHQGGLGPPLRAVARPQVPRPVDHLNHPLSLSEAKLACPAREPYGPKLEDFWRTYEVRIAFRHAWAKSFRMSKSDLQARPVYHRKRDSIEAHLTIVFAALAVSRWIEAQTGWSIRKFVKTARRYCTVEI